MDVHEQTGFEAGPVSSAIFRVARDHKALAARLLRETGLRPGQELVLMTLWQDGPQRQADLVATLDSDAPTMTRSIARLESAGLVHSEPSSTDRRAVIVEATQKSLGLRDKVETAWADLERITVGSLTPEQQNEAIRILGDLEENVTAADDTPPASPP